MVDRGSIRVADGSFRRSSRRVGRRMAARLLMLLRGRGALHKRSAHVVGRA
jgi:hypothetical protein